MDLSEFGLEVETYGSAGREGLLRRAGAVDAKGGKDGVVVVKVPNERVQELREIHFRNWFCSAVQIWREGDREEFVQIEELCGEKCHHSLDHGNELCKIKVNKLLLYEDGRDAVFRLKGVQSSPMWQHLDFQLVEFVPIFAGDVVEESPQIEDLSELNRVDIAAREVDAQLRTLQRLYELKYKLHS